MSKNEICIEIYFGKCVSDRKTLENKIAQLNGFTIYQMRPLKQTLNNLREIFSLNWIMCVKNQNVFPEIRCLFTEEYRCKNRINCTEQETHGFFFSQKLERKYSCYLCLCKWRRTRNTLQDMWWKPSLILFAYYQGYWSM